MDQTNAVHLEPEVAT